MSELAGFDYCSFVMDQFKADIKSARLWATISVTKEDPQHTITAPVEIALEPGVLLNTAPPLIEMRRRGNSFSVSIDFAGRRYRDLCDISKSPAVQKLIDKASAWFAAHGWHDYQTRLLEARIDHELENCDDEDVPKKNLSEMIIETVQSEGKLFRCQDGKPFLSVDVDQVQHTYGLESMAVRAAIRSMVYRVFEKGISDTSLDDVICQLSAIATHNGIVHTVSMRSGQDETADYIDMADDTWRVIRLSADGWRIIEAKACPVRFVRVDSMQRLPMPSPTSDCRYDELRSFINCPQVEEWQLLVAWIIQAMRPRGPYPILCVSGEQGSAKSTLSEFVRMLIDPNKANLRRPPKEDRDIGVAARNSKIVCYENMSKLSDSMADTLCTLATGGGFAERQLYSNGEEFVFNACCPVILNGISGLLTRGDVADRAINLHLPTIGSSERKTADELKAQFLDTLPRLLGGFCTLYCAAMRELPNVVLDDMPRMADFARLGVAVERVAGWEPGSFLEAYNANREESSQAVLEESNIVPILSHFLDNNVGRFQGTATELLDALGEYFPEKLRPRTPSTLSALIRRLAPALRSAGFVVDTKKTKGVRKWVLSRQGTPTTEEPSDPY